MKRLKSFGALVTAALLATSLLVSPVIAGSSAEKVRVLIETDQSTMSKELKSKYGKRWEFENNQFTTEVTPQQYEQLVKLDRVQVSLVPTAGISARPGSSSRPVPSDQTPWGLEAMYNNTNLSQPAGGSGIRVAVLDTGGLQSHPDLKDNAEQCKDFTSAKGLNVGACDDKNGHGTHVAGTILANGGADKKGIYGVAPESKLWSYKVLGNSGFGYSDDIAAAIRHAADESISLGVKTIVSMSLGSSSKDTLIADAVTYAVNKGVLVVAAAGNDGPNANTIGFPGGLTDAVAVAALENVVENGTYRIADFSSRGNPSTAGDYVIHEKDVEVSAPGRAIESTWNDGKYNTISGTSMATPHVSGLAAKIWASNPTWTNKQIRTELQNRAKNNDVKSGLYAGTGDDIASGFGFPTVSSTDQ